MGNALVQGGQAVDNNLFGGRIGSTIESSKEFLKKQYQNLIKPIQDKFKPVTNLLSSIKSGAESAIKKGPDAFREFFQSNIQKVKNLLQPALDASEPFIRKLAPIMGCSIQRHTWN